MTTPRLVALNASVAVLEAGVASVAANALARPKSKTLTLCSGVILMFSGLRSRWMSQALSQSFTGDQFHDQVGEAAGSFETVDGGDIRMVQRSQNLCLALEARDAFWIPRELVGEDFDGDIPA